MTNPATGCTCGSGMHPRRCTLHPCAYDAHVAELNYENAQDEIAELRAQLPDGMQDCTIKFIECTKGHGRLTATNWVKYDCHVCERDQLRAKLEIAREALRYYADGRQWTGFSGAFIDDADDELDPMMKRVPGAKARAALERMGSK